MTILKEIEASVIIDGKALTEYDDEDTRDENSDPTSQVSKYIEAISGAEFSISVTMPRSYNFVGDAVKFELRLDGVCVFTWLCREVGFKDLRKDWHGTIAGHQAKNGEEWYLRPFKFDDIKIGETKCPYAGFSYSLKDSVEASSSVAGSVKSNDLANLGIIALDVFDEEVMRRSHSADTSAVRLGQLPEIAEKELKGRDVTHQATFGESRPSTGLNRWHTKHLSKKPILSFKFNYRSSKALQGLRLIPMTPSPFPVPTPVPLEERPVDSLTPDELQELGRRFHAKCQAEREANIKPEKIKSERGVKREQDQEHKNVIMSSTAKKAKTRPFEQGETIELD